MAAEKNACSNIDEFGGKVKESLGERIRDKGVENDGKLDELCRVPRTRSTR